MKSLHIRKEITGSKNLFRNIILSPKTGLDCTCATMAELETGFVAKCTARGARVPAVPPTPRVHQNMAAYAKMRQNLRLYRGI